MPDTIWTAASGASMSKTHFDMRENGWWLSSGAMMFPSFVSDEEALALAKAIIETFRVDLKEIT